MRHHALRKNFTNNFKFLSKIFPLYSPVDVVKFVIILLEISGIVYQLRNLTTHQVVLIDFDCGVTYKFLGNLEVTDLVLIDRYRI